MMVREHMKLCNNKKSQYFWLKALLMIYTCLFQSTLYALPDTKDVFKNSYLSIEMGVDLNRDGVIQWTEYGTDGNPLPNPDMSSRDKPFRFWVNNDFDVVSLKGSPVRDAKECGKLKYEGSKQVCEQVDLTTGQSNLEYIHDQIESIRDLEDFFVFAIRLNPWQESFSDFSNYKIKIRPNGFSLNVYKQSYHQWLTGSLNQYKVDTKVHIEDLTIAKNQVLERRIMNLVYQPGNSDLLGRVTVDNNLFDSNDGVAPCN